MSHAILSASGADRWLHCPASVPLEAKLPDKGSEFALEGTTAHRLAELCLNKGAEPIDYIGLKLDDEDGTELMSVSHGMAEAVEKYLIYVNELKAWCEQTWVETRVNFSAVVPEGFGTCDFLGVQYDRIDNATVLHVVDYKHGKGVEVSAEYNPQLMLYGLGALIELEPLLMDPIDRIELHVVQPRINNFSNWGIDKDKLLIWANSIVRPNAEKAYSLYKDPSKIDESDFVPTEKGCKFCKGKGSCKALASLGYETALKGFEDLTAPINGEDFKSVTKLSNEEAGKAYLDMSLFVSWYDSLKSEIMDRLMRGEEVDGLKVVAGRSMRKWSIEDEEELIKKLRASGLRKDQYIKESLISPTEAEKALKKAKPADHKKRYQKLDAEAIVKAEGSPTIVKDSDKRPSIAPSAKDFDDVSEDQTKTQTKYTKE